MVYDAGVERGDLGRVIGDRLRGAREARGAQLGRRYSQEDLAAAAGVSVDAVRRIEQGRLSRLDLTTYSSLAEALGVSTQWFCSPEDGTVAGGQSTKRREFIIGAAAAAGVGATQLETVRRGLIATTPNSAEAWEHAAYETAASYKRMDPGVLVAELSSDLAEIDLDLQAARTRNPRQRQSLARSAAKMSTFLAFGLRDIGEMGQSQRWHRASWRLSDESECAHTRVWTRSRAAISLLYTHDLPQQALRLADEAMRIGGSEYAYEPLGVTSQALAQLGRRDEAREALSELRRSWAAASRTQDVAALGWPAQRLLHTESYCLAHLGDPEANRAREDSLSSYSREDVSSRALVELHGALSLTHSGEHDGAAELATSIIAPLQGVTQIALVVKLGGHVYERIPADLRDRSSVQHLAQAVYCA